MISSFTVGRRLGRCIGRRLGRQSLVMSLQSHHKFRAGVKRPAWLSFVSLSVDWPKAIVGRSTLPPSSLRPPKRDEAFLWSAHPSGPALLGRSTGAGETKAELRTAGRSPVPGRFGCIWAAVFEVVSKIYK